MNCGCHCCRLGASECYGKHPRRELRKARHLNGAYWWGMGKACAKGRMVNICVHCINAFEDCDDGGVPLKALFGMGPRRTR